MVNGRFKLIELPTQEQQSTDSQYISPFPHRIISSNMGNVKLKCTRPNFIPHRNVKHTDIITWEEQYREELHDIYRIIRDHIGKNYDIDYIPPNYPALVNMIFNSSSKFIPNYNN